MDKDDFDINEFPLNVRKPDITVNSKQDLIDLFNTLSYWQVKTIPKTVFDYIHGNEDFKANEYEFAQEYLFWGCLDQCKFDKINLLKSLESLAKKDYRRAIIPNEFIFKYIVDLNIEKLDEEFLCEDAVLMNSFEMLLYAREKGCQWNSKVFDTAASVGNLKIIKYIHENGCPHTENSLFIASFSNKVDCFEYLISEGFKPDINCYAGLIYKNDLKNLSKIWNINRPNEIEVILCVCLTAGKIEMLKFFYENGCPFTEKFSTIVLEKDNELFLRFLHEHNLPILPDACLNAANKDALKCLTFLHENGYQWDEMVAIVAYRKSKRCFDYLVQNGCPIPYNIENAVENETEIFI